jgi:enoyl-CoA hydratase/carnithine racemase
MPSVRYEKLGAVGHIILCDPPHNFLNVEFCDQLRAAVMSATADDLRAVLVRAEGPNFCGGGDPAVMPNLTFDAFRVFITEYNRSYRALEALQVPTVAAVRGNVFGGGVELALSCDFIVAARASSCPMRRSRARLLTSRRSLRTARRSVTPQYGRSSRCGHQAASPEPMR